MTDRRVGIGQIIAFGTVQLPLGAIGLPIAIYLAPLYGGELGLGLQLIGTALILARMSDFVVDPIIGVLTDRWRPRIGRRRVWLILGTIAMMAGVRLLFQPGSSVGIVYFFAALSLVYFGFTLIQLPVYAWAAELSSDYHLRTRISSVGQFFGILGLIVSTLIPSFVLAHKGVTSADVMAAMSHFILVAMPVCAAIVFFLVPEPPAPIAKASFNLFATLKSLASNKSFVRITFVVLIATIGEVFRQSITVFFARDVVGVANVGIIYFYYFAAALAGVPFWTWLARRIEKHRSLCAALAVVAVADAAMFFVGHGQTTLFTVLFVLKGSCYGALLMLPGAMVADTVDIDTAKTLDRQQGVFFAAIAMVQKMGFALGGGLPLLILGAANYRSVGETLPLPLLALRVSYSVIPAVLVLIAAAMVWGYALTAARHRVIRDEIDARLAAASEQALVRASG